MALGLSGFRVIHKLLIITIHKFLTPDTFRHSTYPKAIFELNKKVKYRNINLFSVVILS